MFKRTFLLGILLLLGLRSASIAAEGNRVIEVNAVVETAESRGDGATSPLIWLHPTDLTQSLIIGTDDNVGIGVYDLTGNLLQTETQFGALAGADLRYNFGSQQQTLIIAAVKDEPQLMLLTINPETRSLDYLGEVATEFPLAVACLYQSPLTHTFYAIALSEMGKLAQYAISEDDGEISTTLTRSIEVGGEVESCVADDAFRRLYTKPS